MLEHFDFPADLACPGPLDDISQMLPEERLLLYSLVCSLRPQRILEIGRSRGGSTVIMTSAIRHLGQGWIVSIDLENLAMNRMEPQLMETLGEWVTFIAGSSPEELNTCCQKVGAPFDFVLLDSDHHYESVLGNLKALPQYLAPEARILVHDAWHESVARAIADACAQFGFDDQGMISRHRSIVEPEPGQVIQPGVWGGFRLLVYAD